MSVSSCDPMDCSPPGSSDPGIPRQEYWSGLTFPSPEDLPDPGIQPTSPVLAGVFFATEPTHPYPYCEEIEGDEVIWLRRL